MVQVRGSDALPRQIVMHVVGSRQVPEAFWR